VSSSPSIDRAPQKFSQNKDRVDHTRAEFIALYETSQGDLFDSFSAIADLLIIGGEDFFDLSGVLQSGHGYFVRHCFWFEALSA